MCAGLRSTEDLMHVYCTYVRMYWPSNTIERIKLQYMCSYSHFCELN